MARGGPQVSGALFVDPIAAPKRNIRLSRKEEDGLFIEVISRDKLFAKMQERRYDVAKLVKRSGLSESSIRKYLSGEQTRLSCRAMDKLADALRCSPAALSPDAGIPIEKVIPLPKQPAVTDLRDLPLPELEEGQLYMVVRKQRGQREDSDVRSTLCKFVGTHKGNGVYSFNLQATTNGFIQRLHTLHHAPQPFFQR